MCAKAIKGLTNGLNIDQGSGEEVEFERNFSRRIHIWYYAANANSINEILS